MTPNHQSAAKLAAIADTFANLAEDHVRRAAHSDSHPAVTLAAQAETTSENGTTEVHQQRHQAALPPPSPHQPDQQQQQQQEFPQALLDYFTAIATPASNNANSSSSGTSATAGTLVQNSSGAVFGDVPGFDTTSAPAVLNASEDSGGGCGGGGESEGGADFDGFQLPEDMDLDGMLQNLGERAAERPLDVGFDWLAWEDSSVGGGGSGGGGFPGWDYQGG